MQVTFLEMHQLDDGQRHIFTAQKNPEVVSQSRPPFFWPGLVASGATLLVHVPNVSDCNLSRSGKRCSPPKNKHKKKQAERL